MLSKNIIEILKKENTKKHLYLILIIIFFSFIWIKLYNYNIYFRYKDNFDYSQMGREIKKGKGFKTLQIFPGYLKYFKEKKNLHKNWPNLYRFPLPTLSNTLFQFFFNPLNASIIQSGFWFFITIILIYYVIYNQTKRILYSLFGIVLFFLDHFTYSYSGLSETLTSFLFVLLISLFFLFKVEDKKRLIFSGIILGLLFLSRTTFLYLFPLFLIFFILKRYKLELIILFTLSFIFIIFPWTFRNYNITGNPMFSFSNIRGILLPFSKVDPALTIDMEYSFGKILKEKKLFIIKNFKQNFSKIFKKFCFLLYPYCWFLLFSFIFIFIKKKSEMKELFFFILISFFLNYLFYSLFKLNFRYFVSFRPLFILLFFITFINSKINIKYKKVNSFILIIFFSFSFFVSFLKDQSFYKNSKVIPSINFLYDKKQELQKMIKKDLIIISNISHATALFLERKSIRLPYEPESISEIDKDFIKIGFIIIDKSKKSHLNSKYRKYNDLLKSQIFLENFVKINIFKYRDLLIYKKRREKVSFNGKSE